MPEGDFRPAQAQALLRMNRSLHFAPGTGYSYSNGNFRILAETIAQKTGRAFGEYLMQQVVLPAGMESAIFAPETAALPGGAAGYEGTLETGWRPGINRIHWAGDAGLCGSLDDMIAWESYIDRTRGDADGIYARLSQPVTFRNGTAARYGLGLARARLWGRDMTGHGGAIRGWRLQRFWVPSERLSVAVVFNHESDAKAAAQRLLAAALGEGDVLPATPGASTEGFTGSWLDESTGLLLDIAAIGGGRLSATYGGSTDVLGMDSDGAARGQTMQLTLAHGSLRIDRAADAIHSTAVPAGEPRNEDLSGVYRSEEFGSELQILTVGGSAFAGFRGFLGQGPLMPLLPAGLDVWRLVCKRSLDAPSPGDWTIRLVRDGNGKLAALSIGCWLARNISFERQA
jgi:D-aminopeptidase